MLTYGGGSIKKNGIYDQVVAALKAAWESGDKDKAKNLSLILARLAELMAGAEIEDPAAFVSEVSELF